MQPLGFVRFYNLCSFCVLFHNNYYEETMARLKIIGIIEEIIKYIFVYIYIPICDGST